MVSLNNKIKNSKPIKKTSKKAALSSVSKKKKVVVKVIKKDKVIKKTKKVSLSKVIKKVALKKNIFKKKKKLITLKKKIKVEKISETKEEVKKIDKSLRLKKVITNPIISPSLYSWESKATFNPAAFSTKDGNVHIIYRAIGDDDSSVLGYANTEDGFTIKDRNTFHVYKRFFNYNQNLPKIDYISGGGWSGGCEDPRIVLIDGIIYMLYNAFDGWGSIRVGLTSMKLTDFENNKWNWKKGMLISPLGQRHKNWVLFPEKINGKFAILHNLHSGDFSRVLIEYLDSLEEEDFKKANFNSPDPNLLPDMPIAWHRRMRSVGPPPIKTKDGWLILYHAMDTKNPDKYKMGALMLDLNDPTKVIYRSNNPILEPEEAYEIRGHQGIVYSCGAVVKEGELFVYYGGGDKFVCVASVSLNDLINSMKEDKIIKLKNIKDINNI